MPKPTPYDLHGLQFKKNATQWMNDQVFFDYYMRLKNIAINMFEWVNLPDTCDARFMELILFEFGHVLFFRNEINKSFFTLQSATSGRLNMYHIPIERTAYAITGFNQQCNDLNSVIIYNNYLRQPTELTIRLYAQRLATIERAIDVNINGQKTPILIYGTEAQQKTLQKIYQQYSGNEPIIFGDKNLQENPLQCLKTEVPERYPNLMMAKHTVWNEAMTFLGVDNANTDKKERMITDEVESNNELLKAQRYSFLNARKDACKIINELFADELEAPIDVRFREYVQGGESKAWQDTQPKLEQSVSSLSD